MSNKDYVHYKYKIYLDIHNFPNLLLTHLLIMFIQVYVIFYFHLDTAGKKILALNTLKLAAI